MGSVSGFALVALVATLGLLLALNWGMFQRIGAAGIVRLSLIWAVILVGGVVVLKLFGF